MAWGVLKAMRAATTASRWRHGGKTCRWVQAWHSRRCRSAGSRPAVTRRAGIGGQASGAPWRGAGSGGRATRRRARFAAVSAAASAILGALPKGPFRARPQTRPRAPAWPRRGDPGSARSRKGAKDAQRQDHEAPPPGHGARRGRRRHEHARGRRRGRGRPQGARARAVTRRVKGGAGRARRRAVRMLRASRQRRGRREPCVRSRPWMLCLRRNGAAFRRLHGAVLAPRAYHAARPGPHAPRSSY